MGDFDGTKVDAHTVTVTSLDLSAGTAHPFLTHVCVAQSRWGRQRYGSLVDEPPWQANQPGSTYVGVRMGDFGKESTRGQMWVGHQFLGGLHRRGGHAHRAQA